MKLFEFHKLVVIIRIALPGVLTILVACSNPQTSTPIPPVADSLTCLDCELVEVFGVVDANTLSTSVGEIQPYGTYVLDQPADCAEQAETRLRVLAGDQIRIEAGPADTIRQDTNHYYLYTSDGDSIEQQLIHEGLALIWSQDGQHLGWFLFRDASAKENESGCLWHDYQAFQRGEPNEFRIPGLTYPKSDDDG
ncbi:MAG: hypothetical protein H8D69_00305 [Chloroflexi bacterium]|nr:hypothetical protein [Chloroflexota bacterium]